VGVRSKHGRLFLDFRWRGVRCREFTDLPDTPENRRRCTTLLRIIKGEIAFGTSTTAATSPTAHAPDVLPRDRTERRHRRVVSVDLARPPVSLSPRWYRCRDGGVASVDVEA
jgi:hypothetical protein